MSRDLVPAEAITRKIYLIRNRKVILDRDLAELYGVDTGQLKRAVRRNADRFPSDFMFELSREELEDWRCQFGTSNAIKMGLRHSPMAFTEQGVAMLSGVINSKRAIQIIRDKVREAFAENTGNYREVLEEIGFTWHSQPGEYWLLT